MEGNNVSVAFPLCSNMTSDIPETGTILEEGPRICPLCSSIIRLFFINFNEKLLMCENTECEFPFGHEELQFVKEDNDLQFNDEVTSIRTQMTGCSPSATQSVVSTSAWSEIEKINRVYDSEDSQFDLRPVNNNEREFNLRKHMVQKENERKITSNLDNIKQLNAALESSEGTPKLCLKNEKWIRNLRSLQELSGVQLLRQQEIDKLKKKETNLGLGELKIDIDSSCNSRSSIKIEIANKEKKS